jgi:hypothetical protein
VGAALRGGGAEPADPHPRESGNEVNSASIDGSSTS